jgi:hypothetical protein
VSHVYARASIVTRGHRSDRDGSRASEPGDQPPAHLVLVGEDQIQPSRGSPDSTLAVMRLTNCHGPETLVSWAPSTRSVAPLT